LFCSYSNEELKYFPLNTAIEDPPKNGDLPIPEEKQTDKVGAYSAYSVITWQTLFLFNVLHV